MMLQMQINHRGFQLAMTEQSLDNMNVIALIKHVSRKGMSQRMRRKSSTLETRLLHRTIHHHL